MTLLRIVTLVTLAVHASPRPVAAQDIARDTAAAEIVVHGTGAVLVPPDRAQLWFEITTDDERAEQAASRNAAVVERVTAALQAAGFPEDEVTAPRFNIRPRYARDNRRVTGYTASTTLQLVLDSLPAIGRALDAALAGGVTGVPFIRYDATQRDAARLRALEQALEQARADAETLARAAGGRLGRLLEISTVPAAVGRPSGVRLEALTVTARSFNPARDRGHGIGDRPLGPGPLALSGPAATRS